MELRHIRYFLVLAEELNFSRAAEKLHISQPPLSRQIKELEEEIGARLFHRTKRQVVLTNAGKVFRNKAYQIIEQIEEACISTRFSSTGREGEFQVGFNGSVLDLIPSLKKYREFYPKVGIILKQMNSIEQIKALNEKRIDAALLSVPVNNDNIELFPLVKMYFKAALPEKHPLVLAKALYLQDMADETFIVTTKSTGSLYYEAFMSLFKNAGFTPNITIQADDLQTVLTLVDAGMGVTLTPTPIKPRKGVILRSVEDVNFAITPTLAWRKDNKSEILANYLEFFQKYYYVEMQDVEG